MKKIIILGASVTAVKIIEDLRAVDRDSEILLWSTEGVLPYDPERLADGVAKNISLQDVYCRPESFYDEQKVQLILDKEIARFNFKKNQIVTIAKENVDYTELVLTKALDTKFPEIKGIHKTGIYGAGRLKDVEEFFSSLPFVDTVVVQVDTPQGLSFAAAVAENNKEVIVVPAASLVERLSAESSLVSLPSLEEKGVRIVRDQRIVEILGDGDARAVRLQSGKVISCEAIVFDKVSPHLKIFEETSLTIKMRICVDQNFRTSVANVYACGELCERAVSEKADDWPYTTVQRIQQGQVIAACLSGVAVDSVAP